MQKWKCTGKGLSGWIVRQMDTNPSGQFGKQFCFGGGEEYAPTKHWLIKTMCCSLNEASVFEIHADKICWRLYSNSGQFGHTVLGALVDDITPTFIITLLPGAEPSHPIKELYYSWHFTSCKTGSHFRQCVHALMCVSHVAFIKAQEQREKSVPAGTRASIIN